MSFTYEETDTAYYTGLSKSKRWSTGVHLALEHRNQRRFSQQMPATQTRKAEPFYPKETGIEYASLS
ncbi:hypothetical protein O9992_02620 [Vibrio lentus]|nr:hypothetical protein [Vibrio lentus]